MYKQNQQILLKLHYFKCFTAIALFNRWHHHLPWEQDHEYIHFFTRIQWRLKSLPRSSVELKPLWGHGMDISDCTASGSGAAFLPAVLPCSTTRRFPGAGQHTSSPGAAAAPIPAGRPSSISPGSRAAGVGGAAGAHGGWRRGPRRGRRLAAPATPTRTGGTPGADAEAAAPGLNNIAIQQDPAHTLRRAPSRGGAAGPAGQPAAGAVPQRRRRTPCRPARRPLRTRTAADPTAERGSSEAPRSTEDPAGRGRAPAGRRPSVRPSTRPPPLPVTCHNRRRLRRSGGGASPSDPPATADVRSLQLASPTGAGGQKQTQQKQAGRHRGRRRPPAGRSEPAHRYHRCSEAKGGGGGEGGKEGRKGPELRRGDAARSGSTNPPQRWPHAASRRFRRPAPPSRPGDTSPRGDVTREGAGGRPAAAPVAERGPGGGAHRADRRGEPGCAVRPAPPPGRRVAGPAGRGQLSSGGAFFPVWREGSAGALPALPGYLPRAEGSGRTAELR